VNARSEGERARAPRRRASFPSLLRRFVLLLAAALCAAGGARGDALVQTRAERLHGRLAFRKDGLAVGGKAVGWDAVLFVIQDGHRRHTAPHAVRLVSGEVWAADIVGLAVGRLDLRLPLSGECRVDQKLVAELVFAPLRADGRDGKPRTLYRQQGEPVPGTLIWIDATRIAMDSPLGVLKLSREGVVRYVVAEAKAVPTGDEVHLHDGSILRGPVAVADGRLTVAHAVLGTVNVPAAMVRAVVRRPKGVAYLAEQPFASVEAKPLVASGRRPERVTAPDASAGWLRGVRVWPNAKLAWRLPTGGRPAALRMVLGLDEGCRGGARVRFAAAGRTLHEAKLAPGSGPKPVAFDVPAADALAVEVEFDEPVRFPCSVLLGDPHRVRSESESGK